MAVIAEEQARAIAWQADQRKRADFDRLLQNARRGNPAAAAALALKWEPLQEAMQDNGRTDDADFDSDEANT